jgi:hypothetical protein
MAKRKSKFVLYLFLLIVIIGIVYIFFNEHGLVKYFGLKSKVDSKSKAGE